MPTLNHYKHLAGKIADNAVSNGPDYIYALILDKRRTKGLKAALLCGLVVGALVERGRPELAESMLKDIAKLIDENKG